MLDNNNTSRTGRLWQSCKLALLLLLLTFGLGSGCSSPDLCANARNQIGTGTLNPHGSECTQRCECNNQRYEGYCIKGLCVSLGRASCQIPQREDSCRFQSVFAGAQDAQPNCTERIRICQQDGVSGLFWGDCRCITSAREGSQQREQSTEPPVSTEPDKESPRDTPGEKPTPREEPPVQGEEPPEPLTPEDAGIEPLQDAGPEPPTDTAEPLTETATEPDATDRNEASTEQGELTGDAGTEPETIAEGPPEGQELASEQPSEQREAQPEPLPEKQAEPIVEKPPEPVCTPACAGDLRCLGGSCKCPPNTSTCKSECADFQFDNRHCSGCGNACTAAACVVGSCTPYWSQVAGSTQPDIVRDVVLDARHNVYIVGDFRTPLTLGTTTLTPKKGSSTGSPSDIFVAKLDKNGKFLWARSLEGTSDDYGYGIAVDASQNVYITGSIRGKIEAVTEGLSTELPRQSTGRDVLVARLDPNGKFLWLQVFGGGGSTSNTDEGRDIGLDTAGNLYVVGIASNTTYVYDSFRKQTIQLATSLGAQDGFVAKLNPANGAVTWLKRMGGTSYDSADALAIDTSGIYITGSFYKSTKNTADFGSTRLTNTGGTDYFLTKVDTNGNFLWARGGAGSGDDEGTALALDQKGDVYLTGRFDFSNANFGTACPGYKVPLLNPNSQHDLFVAKYASTGCLYWAKSAGGPEDDRGVSLAVDDKGQLHVMGFYQGQNKTFHWEQNTLSIQWKTGYAERGLLVATLSPQTGKLLQLKGTTEGHFGDAGAIAFGPGGKGPLVVGGGFYDNCLFGGITLVTPATSSNLDLFIAMINWRK